MLHDGAWYKLPDGARVLAVQINSQAWRLNTANGQPVYWGTASGWVQLVYNADLDVYTVVPCNLQISDLVEMTDAE
jgi:hypothetical protein